MPAGYGLIVIGGGAAGLGAAAAGAPTLLVSEGETGGECTFTGCVPSKTLIEAAARGAAFPAAMTAVRDAVAAIAATETADVLAAEGIEVLRGRAAFTSPGEVRVDGRDLRARRLVIATGSQPAVPPVPGLADTDYLTSETIFGLGGLPGRLAVLGGGAVGCALAQAFARLGSQVTDPAFLTEEFFDARDAVQVKYEMVRRVTLDGAPVTATAAAFGYSRPSYYQAAAALAASGLDGLVPGKPGPAGATSSPPGSSPGPSSSWRPIRS